MAQAEQCWIGADIGPHAMTARAVDGAGTITAEVRSAAPAPETRAQAAALRTLCARLAQGGRTLVSGAAVAARGVPCPPLPDAPVALPGDGVQILAVPPLGQSDPPAQSAGSETRVAGYLSRHPGFDGVICVARARLTHWVHVSAGEVVSMQGAVTGTLLAGLETGFALSRPDAIDGDAFDAALARILSRPERLASELAGAALPGAEAAAGHAAILGALVGAELAAARPYWLGQPVALIGDGGPVAAGLARGLAAQGAAPATAADAPTLIAGLAAARGAVVG